MNPDRKTPHTGLIVPTVLLVEPHLALRSVIASALTRANYRCDAVGNPSDALLKLRDHAYSHIMVDVDSPESLSPLCDKLRTDPLLLATVIVITDGVAPNAMGEQPSLLKPFDTRQLLAPLLK